MAFEFTEEHEEFSRLLRRFFEEKSPVTEVRRLMASEPGYEPAVWAQMAEQLGIQGLIVPERYGGLGFGHVELAIAFEEMGRALLCAPCFSTIALATNALLLSGDEDASAAYLPAIAEGRIVATLAVAEEAGSWDPSTSECRAVPSGSGYLIDGEKHLVVDGANADLVLVVARGEEGIGLYAVEAGAPGLSREPRQAFDQTRKLATLRFSSTPARAVGLPGSRSAAALARTLQLASVALSAEQLGGASRCLEMAVEYAKDRVQFGRSIGSFQAIKHMCADMLVEVESARSATYYAAWAAAEGTEDLGMVSSVAQAYCSDAFVRCASDNLQVHGGIGFTWESDCHLYIRRAKASALLLGAPNEHREAVAKGLGM